MCLLDSIREWSVHPTNMCLHNPQATLAETIQCFEAQLSHAKCEVASLEKQCRVLEERREEEEGRVQGLSGEVRVLEETLEAERAAHETRINEVGL